MSAIPSTLHTTKQVQIFLEILSLKTGRLTAIIIFRKILKLGEPSRQKSASQGAVGYESDAQLATGREHVIFRIARPQRIFGLQCRD